MTFFCLSLSSSASNWSVCFMGVDSSILKKFYHLVPLAALGKPDPSLRDVYFCILRPEIVRGTKDYGHVACLASDMKSWFGPQDSSAAEMEEIAEGLGNR